MGVISGVVIVCVERSVGCRAGASAIARGRPFSLEVSEILNMHLSLPVMEKRERGAIPAPALGVVLLLDASTPGGLEAACAYRRSPLSRAAPPGRGPSLLGLSC